MAFGENAFVVEAAEPAYLDLHRAGKLAERREAAMRELASCRACPRNCGVDRSNDETGTCGVGRNAVVASAFPHLGEEDCLRGWRGSGTIFFSRCNLHCVFCQNWDLSQHLQGEALDAEAIADLMLVLQQKGCHNVNFVTPEHVAPQVIEAIAYAVPRGLRLPLVYNTSAYDSLSTLRLLDGLIDIYMPDFKLWRAESARRLLHAKDYPDRAREAILEMHRQVGPLRLDRNGVARRGVIVRHLVMPGLLEETAAIFDWLARAVSRDTFVNVMAQYRPAHFVGQPGRGGRPRFPEIDRCVRPREMEEAYNAARDVGLWRFDERRIRFQLLEV
jgi:putative pyruvate formate lyase activating enzyme